MKKNKDIKFGLLGLGTVVKLRVFNLFNNELKNIKVISVFDNDKRKTLEYSKKFNCQLIKNRRNFLLSDFNVCYISTPSGSHYKDILDCFKYNKHVVVEKPPVLKVSQLLILNRIALKKKLNFHVIYQNRENKAVKFVKNFLQKNIKDKVILVNLNLFWSRPQKYYSRWHGKWKHDGGVLSQQGVHYIDLLCYFFGKPMKAISEILNISNKLEAEDTHIGLVKFKNVTCSIGLTTALKSVDLKASIDIICQNKQISLFGNACNKVSITNYNKRKDSLNKLCIKNSQNFKSGVGISHYESLKKVVDSYLDKRSFPLKAIDTMNTLKLINMLYLSAHKKSWIINNKKIISSKLGN